MNKAEGDGQSVVTVYLLWAGKGATVRRCSAAEIGRG